MTRLHGAILSTAVLALLAGCANRPMGPTVAVMPAANKNFDQFAQEQTVCKGYADQQVGGQPQQANNQAVGGAILGTALGAGIGAAAGGGVGAAIGAASGAALGTGLGAGYSNAAGYDIQRQYNIAFAQCMAAHGNSVPTQQAAYSPPQPYFPAYGYPYPYAGYYPYYAGYGPYFGGVSFGWGGGWGRGWRRW